MHHSIPLTLTMLVACQPGLAPNGFVTANVSDDLSSSTDADATPINTIDTVTGEPEDSGGGGSCGGSGGATSEDPSTGSPCAPCEPTATRCDVLDLLCGQLGPVDDGCSALHVMCVQGAAADETCPFLAALAPDFAGLAAACECAFAECPAPAVSMRR